MLKKIIFHVVAILVMLATAALAFAGFINEMALPPTDDHWGHTFSGMYYLVAAGFMILPEVGLFIPSYLLVFNENRTQNRISTWITLLIVSAVFIFIFTVPIGVHMISNIVSTDYAGLREFLAVLRASLGGKTV